MVIARVDELLPLPDHAQLVVVEQGDLDRNVVLDERHEFLNGHLQAAVADDRPRLLVGATDCRSHRRGQPKAHGPQAARADMALGPAEARIASGPHLVLADVRHDRCVMARGLADLRNHVVGRQLAVAPSPGTVPRGLLRLRPPFVDLPQVCRAALRRHRLDLGQ